MTDIIKIIMSACNLSRADAIKELECARRMVEPYPDDFEYITEIMQGLGLEPDYIMEFLGVA